MQITPLDVGAGIEAHFPQKCPTLAKNETYCNYIADGATLCAYTHSKHWQQFMTCKYQQALKMAANPFLTEATFDSALEECAKDMSDYSADQLRACAYGDEAETLRTTSRVYHMRRVFADAGLTSPGLAWATVASKFVTDPATENYDSRVPWQAKLLTAICAEYKGTKPAACSSMVIA